MIPFLSPAHRYRRRLDRRIRLAYLIHEDLALQSELKKNLVYAEEAVSLVRDDEAHYERLLGKTPPNHLTGYLTAELCLWLFVRDHLTYVGERDLFPADYRKEAERIRDRLEDAQTMATIIKLSLKGPLPPTWARKASALASR